MSSELRKIIELAIELILLGAIVVIVVLSATVGRGSLNEYLSRKDAKIRLPSVVAYSKGSVGYYELIDLIDSYAEVTEVTIKYKNNDSGYSTVTFTQALDGKTVRLALGDTLPKRGVDFTGTVYGRQDGVMYRNGIATTTDVMELDLKLDLNTLKGINDLQGHGVTDYSFVEVLFDFAKDKRFVCTVTQTYDTGTIDRLTLEMQE